MNIDKKNTNPIKNDILITITRERLERLTSFVNKLNNDIIRDYYHKYRNNVAFLESLFEKGLVDKITRKPTPVKVEYSKRVLLPDYSNGTIYINPLIESLLHNSYRKFQGGDLTDIGKKDYSSEDIKFSDDINFEKLTVNEMLYWCYSHNVTYEKFIELTVMHQLFKRFGIDYYNNEKLSDLSISILEGLTEMRTVDYAREKGITFLPILYEKPLKIARNIEKKYKWDGLSTTTNIDLQALILRDPLEYLNIVIDPIFFGSIFDEKYRDKFINKENKEENNKDIVKIDSSKTIQDMLNFVYKNTSIILPGKLGRDSLKEIVYTVHNFDDNAYIDQQLKQFAAEYSAREQKEVGDVDGLQASMIISKDSGSVKINENDGIESHWVTFQNLSENMAHKPYSGQGLPLDSEYEHCYEIVKANNVIIHFRRSEGFLCLIIFCPFNELSLFQTKVLLSLLEALEKYQDKFHLVEGHMRVGGDEDEIENANIEELKSFIIDHCNKLFSVVDNYSDSFKSSVKKSK